MVHKEPFNVTLPAGIDHNTCLARQSMVRLTVSRKDIPNTSGVDNWSTTTNVRVTSTVSKNTTAVHYVADTREDLSASVISSGEHGSYASPSYSANPRAIKLL